MVWHDYRFDVSHLIGDLVVLASVLAVVGTLVIGRSIRQRLSFASFTFAVSAIALLTALFAYALRPSPLSPADSVGWVALGLLVLGPTLFGHSAFHYLVRYVRAFLISLVIVAEPLISLAMKAALEPHFAVFEGPSMTPVQIIGAAVLLGGVVLGLSERLDSSGG